MRIRGTGTHPRSAYRFARAPPKEAVVNPTDRDGFIRCAEGDNAIDRGFLRTAFFERRRLRAIG